MQRTYWIRQLDKIDQIRRERREEEQIRKEKDQNQIEEGQIVTNKKTKIRLMEDRLRTALKNMMILFPTENEDVMTFDQALRRDHIETTLKHNPTGSLQIECALIAPPAFDWFCYWKGWLYKLLKNNFEECEYNKLIRTCDSNEESHIKQIDFEVWKNDRFALSPFIHARDFRHFLELLANPLVLQEFQKEIDERVI